MVLLVGVEVVCRVGGVLLVEEGWVAIGWVEALWVGGRRRHRHQDHHHQPQLPGIPLFVAGGGEPPHST